MVLTGVAVGRVDCPPLVSRGSGFGGIGVRQGTFGRVAGVGLTCIQETQLLPAEVTFFPPVYEVPGRKSAPFCEPPRAPRAFPRDHVSQKQFSGERECAARAPMARHRSSTIRGKVILDELPGGSVEPRFRARWCGGRRGRRARRFALFGFWMIFGKYRDELSNPNCKLQTASSKLPRHHFEKRISAELFHGANSDDHRLERPGKFRDGGFPELCVKIGIR